MLNNLFKIHNSDNVTISLDDSKSFKRGFKYANSKILKGKPILKYGIQIGKATTDIDINEEVHIHNMEYVPANFNFSTTDKFDGEDVNTESKCLLYKNPHGGYATQKNILLISSVSCVNGLATEILHIYNGTTGPEDVRVLPLTNPSGCGHVSSGNDISILRNLIQGYIDNPNCFGAIVLRLGCEDFQGKVNTKKPLFDITFQENTSREEVITKSREFINSILNDIRSIKRQDVCSSNLIIGLQCGGSDGLSAITCNPQLGIISDYHNSIGGKTILAETPEILGSREWLLSRCEYENKLKLKQIFKNWDDGKNQFDNPSPGNISGGISNIFEKSLGSVLKGGTSKISGIINYGDQLEQDSGLYFLDSPGYDPMSITGQIAAGANIICFTTGKGSSYQNSFTPVYKISSNTFLSNRINGLIDFNAQDNMFSSTPELIKKMYKSILDFSSGNSKNRTFFNTNDFIPWLKEGSN